MKEIKLTQNKSAFVDDEDFEYLNQWKWFASKDRKTFYALRTPKVNGKQVTISMHREIMKMGPSKMVVDHRDGNGLNNQRANLRIATRQQNACNRISANINSTSRFLGVCKYNDKKWKATIRKDRVIHLGFFNSEIEAAIAYNTAAKKYHGEFATLNEI